MLSYVSAILAVDYAAGTIKVEKMLEQGKQVVVAKLPAVISVMKGINEPRTRLSGHPQGGEGDDSSVDGGGSGD